MKIQFVTILSMLLSLSASGSIEDSRIENQSGAVFNKNELVYVYVEGNGFSKKVAYICGHHKNHQSIKVLVELTDSPQKITEICKGLFKDMTEE